MTPNNGDSSIINYKNKRNLTSMNSICFSTFNRTIINDKQHIESAIIIIEKFKIKHHSQEFIDTFFKKILKTGVIPFKLIDNEVDDRYELYLDLDKCKNKTYLQYTVMIIRCLYESRTSDGFQIIAKHFVNLCNFFPRKDKGLLFTISCNIFINEQKLLKGYGFNSNHILMYNNGCKILTTKQIVELLDLNKGINDNFTDPNINLDKYILKDETKEEYSKMF